MKSQPSAASKPRRRSHRLPAHFVFILLTTATASLADNSVKLQVALKHKLDGSRNSMQQVNRRWLAISATAFHLEQPSMMRLEWTFFGDDLAAGKMVKQAEGVESVTMDQGGSIQIKTQEVAFVATPRHSVTAGGGKRARAKTVEATGTHYHGWAVRAFIGGKLAGEAHSADDIKNFFGDSE